MSLTQLVSLNRGGQDHERIIYKSVCSMLTNVCILLCCMLGGRVMIWYDWVMVLMVGGIFCLVYPLCFVLFIKTWLEKGE
jgi:predicted MFS family arabinose efflux permease